MKKNFIFIILFCISILFTYGIERPGYIKSTGFFVLNGKLYDGNNNEFIIRGVNNPHTWYPQEALDALDDIASAGFNTVRLVWDTSRTAEELRSILQEIINNEMIPIPELHDVTGSNNTDDIKNMARYWARDDIKAVLHDFEKYIIVNIANEWSYNQIGRPGGLPVSYWYDAYKEAIDIMRQAGIKSTIMIDTERYGQGYEGILMYGWELLMHDHQHNLLFDIHMYVEWNEPGKIIEQLQNAKDLKLPLVIGEFGFNYDNGNNNLKCTVDAPLLMKECQEHSIGYIAWSWCGNSDGHEWLDMTYDWTNLSNWGNMVVNDPNGNGIASTSRKCSVFPGAGSPPEIIITYPSDSNVFNAGDNIVIQADATDDAGISEVMFYKDNEQLGSDLVSGPFLYDWQNVQEGNYKIRAEVKNISGYVISSDVINILVKNDGANSYKKEAESGITANTDILNNINASGGFYVGNFDMDNDNVAVNINTDISGTYNLVIGYSVPGLSDQINTIFINGNAVGRLVFPSTNGDFKEILAGNVCLDNGMNTIGITLEADFEGNDPGNDSGNINVDYFIVNPAPVVSLAQPVYNNAIDPGDNISIRVIAADNSPAGLEKIEFYNGNQLLGEDPEAPYEHVIQNVEKGSYGLFARAIDYDGAASSSPVTFVTAGTMNIQPAVSITNINQNANFPAGSDINISASAEDIDGTIDHVEFYAGDILLGNISEEPYNFTWTNVPKGRHYLTVKAFDNEYSAGTSIKTIYAYDSLPGVMEAELGTLTGTKISYVPPYDSGFGYVTGMDSADDKVSVNASVDTVGWYKLIVHYASKFGYKFNSIGINNKYIYTIFPESESFTDKIIENVYLNAGNNTISVKNEWGWIDIDYFKIEPVSNAPDPDHSAEIFGFENEWESWHSVDDDPYTKRCYRSTETSYKNHYSIAMEMTEEINYRIIGYGSSAYAWRGDRQAAYNMDGKEMSLYIYFPIVNKDINEKLRVELHALNDNTAFPYCVTETPIEITAGTWHKIILPVSAGAIEGRTKISGNFNPAAVNYYKIKILNDYPQRYAGMVFIDSVNIFPNEPKIEIVNYSRDTFFETGGNLAVSLKWENIDIDAYRLRLKLTNNNDINIENTYMLSDSDYAANTFNLVIPAGTPFGTARLEAIAESIDSGETLVSTNTAEDAIAIKTAESVMSIIDFDNTVKSGEKAFIEISWDEIDQNFTNELVLNVVNADQSINITNNFDVTAESGQKLFPFLIPANTVPGTAGIKASIIRKGTGETIAHAETANDAVTITPSDNVHSLTTKTIYTNYGSNNTGWFWESTKTEYYLDEYGDPLNGQDDTSKLSQKLSGSRPISFYVNYQVAGTVSITAFSSSYAGNGIIEVLIDGASAGSFDMQNSSSFTVNVGAGYHKITFVKNGAYWYWARIYSYSFYGAFGEKNAAQINITNPQHVESFFADEDIIIQTDVSRISGNMDYVEFFAGSDSIGKDFNGPDYNFNWNSHTCGYYGVYAKAVYDGTKESYSTPVNINIMGAEILDYTKHILLNENPGKIDVNVKWYDIDTQNYQLKLKLTNDSDIDIETTYSLAGYGNKRNTFAINVPAGTNSGSVRLEAVIVPVSSGISHVVDKTENNAISFIVPEPSLSIINFDIEIEAGVKKYVEISWDEIDQNFTHELVLNVVNQDQSINITNNFDVTTESGQKLFPFLIPANTVPGTAGIKASIIRKGTGETIAHAETVYDAVTITPYDNVHSLTTKTIYTNYGSYGVGWFWDSIKTEYCLDEYGDPLNGQDDTSKLSQKLSASKPISFYVNYQVAGTASIATYSSYAGSGNMEILIDGVSAGNFDMQNGSSFTVNVGAGYHKITFVKSGTYWYWARIYSYSLYGAFGEIIE